MRSKMMPFVVLAGVLAAFLFASSCGNGSSTCPTCGTDTHGTVGLILTMLVPEHNGTGEPGGPSRQSRRDHPLRAPGRPCPIIRSLLRMNQFAHLRVVSF